MLSRGLALAALGLTAANAQDSNSFWNYRHQADVCHAYQVLTKRGFDPAKIITMAYDDVANDPQNPFPGKLFNYPWTTMDEAVDVYAGCKIDYKGANVTPDKFVAVLTGDANTAGGKVLQSKAGDHVFVNFVDHGGVGIIAFPGEGESVLHANRLISTLQEMYSKSMFKQLTFYMEACESGSMFEGLLPANLPVYALTASNAGESSWGTFCGSNATVAGKNVGSCLGDLFSVNWMMDTEKYPKSNNETLLQQFQQVQTLTDKSHVMQYGQVAAFDKEFTSDFEGAAGKNWQVATADVRGPHSRSAVDSRNIKVDQLYRTYLETGSSADAKALVEEIRSRQAAQNLGTLITELALGRDVLLGEQAGFSSWTAPMLGCHQAVVAAFGSHCGWSEARMKLSKTLYQLCTKTSSSKAPILKAVASACAAAAQHEVGSHADELVVV